MSLPTRLSSRTAGAVALGLTAALALATPASAATDWKTMGKLDDARIQACKVSVDGGDAWRVRLRVKNDNDYRVRGMVTAYRGDTATDRTWDSGWVPGGTSEAGFVRTGTGSNWSLIYSLNADQLGGGGSQSIAGLPRC